MPLHMACAQQDLDMIQLLLGAGADLDAADRTGMVPADYVPAHTEIQAGRAATAAVISTQVGAGDDSGPGGGRIRTVSQTTTLNTWLQFEARDWQQLERGRVERRQASRVQEEQRQAQEEAAQRALRAQLVAFYSEHNPEKLGDVDFLLERYKGKEDALFAKLFAKYAKDDVGLRAQVLGTAGGGGGGGGGGDGDGDGDGPSGPFASSSSSSSSSSFHHSSSSSSSSSSSGSGPGSVAPGTPSQHGLREQLIAFYQKHNPAKVKDVDDLLERYKGKEDAMFARLVAKYEGKEGGGGGGGGGSAAGSSGSGGRGGSQAPGKKKSRDKRAVGFFGKALFRKQG